MKILHNNFVIISTYIYISEPYTICEFVILENVFVHLKHGKNTVRCVNETTCINFITLGNYNAKHNYGMKIKKKIVHTLQSTWT